MSGTAEILAACGRSVAAAAVVGLALGALALLLRRPLRRLPPRLQAWCWWLVAARLLLELGGAPAIELAWLPRSERIEPASLAAESGESDWVVVRGLDESLPTAPPNEPARPRAEAPEVAGLEVWAWTGVGALWLVGVILAMARLGAGLRQVAGIVARATPVADSATLDLFDRARALAGVERRVALASSTEIATPLATGLLRPTVLLPVAPRLPPEALRLVLVHELLHLRRHDGWRAVVPALVRRLLFFHPFAAWLEREHALATEAACDAEVVARAEAPAAAYGELLVQFTLGAARRPRLAAAWSLAGPSIHRRLEMLAHDTLRPRQLAALAPLLVLALGAVAAPIRLIAEEEGVAAAATAPAAVSEVEDADAAEVDGWWTSPPPAPAAPLPAIAPVAPPAPGARWSAVRAPRSVAPVPPAEPVPAVEPTLPALPSPPAMPALAPLPPLAPLAPVLPELRGADWLVLWERDAKLSIDAGRWAQRRAEELGRRDGQPVMLLGRGGETFVVRDTAAIAAVRDIFFAQSEAARAQAAVAREAAQAARERSRGAMEESRRAAAEMAREATHEANRMARLASVEAQRVAELERELARSGGEALAAARERAAVAARELAQLEAELERVREAAEAERARRYEASREALEADRERLATELAELDAGSAESRRTLERRLAELESELERRLGEIFTRGLAAPLEP